MSAPVSFKLQSNYMIHLCAEHTSCAILANIRAISCSQAAKRDLLVAYPVIDIRALCKHTDWYE